MRKERIAAYYAGEIDAANDTGRQSRVRIQFGHNKQRKKIGTKEERETKIGEAESEYDSDVMDGDKKEGGRAVWHDF